MPRDVIERVRHDRNTALIDAMILAASADGTMGQSERSMLISRVIERPEFEDIDIKHIHELAESSARRLAHHHKLDDILLSLKERLPNHRSRLLAFGLATAMALADRRASRTELGLLKSLQETLEITEDEVTRIFESIEQGHSLAEALGEPLERLYAETMVLISAADGVVNDVEVRSILENMANDPAFRDVSLDAAENYLRDAAQALAQRGVVEQLSALAHGLTTRTHRSRAFRLALKIARGDGDPSAASLRTLELLQATFGLGDEEVARLAAES